MKTADEWIRALDLKPHPEGGYYREIYRAEETIAAADLPARYGGPRTFSTSIYFLLKSGQVSRFHRLRSDEVWHFYAGASVAIHALRPDGGRILLRLGSESADGDNFQTVLRAGWWFGAEVLPPGPFALMGCTIAPGFVFEDFELARREDLEKEFPDHRDIIARLTSRR